MIFKKQLPMLRLTYVMRMDSKQSQNRFRTRLGILYVNYFEEFFCEMGGIFKLEGTIVMCWDILWNITGILTY